MKKVVVDKKVCIGCGTCVALVPEVFELGKDGKAKVILEKLSEELKKKIEEAIASCPVSAIALTS